MHRNLLDFEICVRFTSRLTHAGKFVTRKFAKHEIVCVLYLKALNN